MRDDELTPGQQALREAARAESARIYGRLQPEGGLSTAASTVGDSRPASVTRVTDIRVARNKKRGAA